VTGPSWVTAFLDLPADHYDADVAFWADVTGYRVSASRGDDGEFASLLPLEGTDFLRVQRVGGATPRIHLDLHVAELDTATSGAGAIGGTVVDRPHDDVTIMRSPGGFVFCLVAQPGGERPPPCVRADGTASYVDQVCLDVPPSRFDDELAFWAALTGWRRSDPAQGSEFGRVTPGGEQPLQLLVQRLDDEQDAVTAHLDWAATDREAEVAVHVSAGAELVGRYEGWTVLRDPAGLTYCITGRRPGDRPE
jgi:hypothetical protein